MVIEGRIEMAPCNPVHSGISKTTCSATIKSDEEEYELAVTISFWGIQTIRCPSYPEMCVRSDKKRIHR